MRSPRRCSASPVAGIKFVDHADVAFLRAKYAHDPAVALDNIVPLDAVWGDHSLAQCLPGERFDFVIASHLIGHVPDMLRWLDEVAGRLNPHGRLILAIPDRRYTFDLLRRETISKESLGYSIATATTYPRHRFRISRRCA